MMDKNVKITFIFMVATSFSLAPLTNTANSSLQHSVEINKKTSEGALNVEMALKRLTY